MEQRISLITLGVADLARSTAFFEALGWQRSVKEAPGISFFQTGGMALALYPREHFFRDIDLPDDGGSSGAVSVAYNARSREEVDDVIRRVEALGAEILKPGHDVFWGGYTSYFRDLDGHIWEVAWNPDLPIAEDGSVTLPD